MCVRRRFVFVGKVVVCTLQEFHFEKFDCPQYLQLYAPSIWTGNRRKSVRLQFGKWILYYVKNRSIKIEFINAYIARQLTHKQMHNASANVRQTSSLLTKYTTIFANYSCLNSLACLCELEVKCSFDILRTVICLPSWKHNVECVVTMYWIFHFSSYKIACY